MRACPARLAKIFLFTKNGKCDWLRAARLVKRDVMAIVADVRRVAMDAKAARRLLSDAYGQAVWSWRPDAGVKLVDGFHGRRWLKSPAHRGERGAAVKTIAQGMPVVRLPCVAC